MKVKVYYNLHRKLFSVVALEGPDKGRVFARVEKIALENVEFRVSLAGRARVLREKRKNVHAFAVGTISSTQDEAPGWANVVVYNPYKYHTFVLRDSLTPVYSARKAWLTKTYILALTTPDQVVMYE